MRGKIAAVAAALSLTLGASVAVAQEGPVELSSGHTDIFFAASTGPENLQLSLLDPQGKPRAPESVVLTVTPQWWKSLAEQYELGQLTSAPAAVLPAVQEPGQLWPGWETLAARDNFNQVDIVFDEVKGPAGGAIYMAGDSQSIASSDPLSYLDDGSYAVRSSRFIHVPRPTHAHVNWAFTKPGVYQMRVHLRDGAKKAPYVCSNTATYTWRVLDPSGQLPATQLANYGAPSVDAGCKHASAPAANPAAPSTEQVNGAQNNGEPGASQQAGDKQGAGAQSGGAQPGGETDANSAALGHASSSDSNATDNGDSNASSSGAPADSESPTAHPSPAAPSPGAQCKPHRVGDLPTLNRGSHVIELQSHVHPSWIFTKPGRYRVVIRQTARTKDGRTLSASTPLNFNVGGAGNADDGHFDIGVGFSGDNLVPVIEDSRTSPARAVSPSALTFGLGDAAKEVVPAGYEFIAQPGETIWRIPQVQKAGVPWVGANAMDAEVVKRLATGVTWTITSVSGPGRVALFSKPSFGKKVNVWLQGGPAPEVKLAANQTVSGSAIYSWTTEDGTPCTPTDEQVDEFKSGRLADSGATPLWWGLIVLALGVSVLGAGIVTVRLPQFRRVD